VNLHVPDEGNIFKQSAVGRRSAACVLGVYYATAESGIAYVPRTENSGNRGSSYGNPEEFMSDRQTASCADRLKTYATTSARHRAADAASAAAAAAQPRA